MISAWIVDSFDCCLNSRTTFAFRLFFVLLIGIVISGKVLSRISLYITFEFFRFTSCSTRPNISGTLGHRVTVLRLGISVCASSMPRSCDDRDRRSRTCASRSFIDTHGVHPWSDGYAYDFEELDCPCIAHCTKHRPTYNYSPPIFFLFVFSTSICGASGPGACRDPFTTNSLDCIPSTRISRPLVPILFGCDDWPRIPPMVEHNLSFHQFLVRFKFKFGTNFFY